MRPTHTHQHHHHLKQQQHCGNGRSTANSSIPSHYRTTASSCGNQISRGTQIIQCVLFCMCVCVCVLVCTRVPTSQPTLVQNTPTWVYSSMHGWVGAESLLMYAAVAAAALAPAPRPIREGGILNTYFFSFFLFLSIFQRHQNNRPCAEACARRMSASTKKNWSAA